MTYKPETTIKKTLENNALSFLKIRNFSANNIYLNKIMEHHSNELIISLSYVFFFLLFI